MNKKRMMAVIDSIDVESFCMADYAHRSRVEPCRTVMCLAGWAAVHAGDPPAFDQLDLDDWDRGWLNVPPSTDVTVSGRCIHNVAREYLGLTHDEANRLFFATNVTTPNDLRILVNEMTAHDRHV